jgi:hypothetical protein
MDSLLAKLKTMDLLRGADGRLHQASRLFAPSSEYVDVDGTPLIAERYLGPNHYLSSEYDMSDQYSGILTELGVRVFSESDFIAALTRMHNDSTIKNQSTSWHESVSAHFRKLRWRYNRQIMSLRMVLLQNGSWVALDSGELFFSSEVTDIPRDLNLRLLAKLDRSSSRFLLLSDLGVKNADPAEICRKILELHRGRPSREHVLTHSHFLFFHRDQQRSRDLERLYLLNQSGGLAQGKELYMNHGEEGIMPLSEIISHSHFLHEKFLTPPPTISRVAWLAWLRDALGVNVSPRVTDGKFSREFLEFLMHRYLDIGHIFRALKDYWPKLKLSVTPDALRALGGQFSVMCLDGAICKLNATALYRGPLKSFSHLHFLRLEDPENASWNFLADLGVTLRPDGLLYLKQLRSLSANGSVDIALIRSIYRQLAARFNDDSHAFDIRYAAIQVQPTVS